MVLQSSVVFLSTWKHACAGELSKFLSMQRDKTVICLTEVTTVAESEVARHGSNLAYNKHSTTLASQVDGLRQLEMMSATHSITYGADHTGDMTCTVTGRRFKNVSLGSALLVRRNVVVIDQGELLIDFKLSGVSNRVVQWVVYQKGSLRYLVAHFHGVWIKGNTKGDHGIRIDQSKRVREYLQQLKQTYRINKVVLGGDFNLDITTQSLQLLCQGESDDEDSYINLIRKFGITSTRTAHYRDYHDAGASLYADYVLVSKNVRIREFAVRTDLLVSDHAPLILTFT